MALTERTPTKKILKLCTTEAMRRSVPRHFLQDTEVKRRILVRLRSNVLSSPETLCGSTVTFEGSQWYHLVAT